MRISDWSSDVCSSDLQTACVVVQNPSVFGHLRDLSGLARACQAKGVLLVVVVTEVTSLGLVTPPGAMGADIVVAEGQAIGVPLSFGGPYVGLFATREKYVRQMPGRLRSEEHTSELQSLMRISYAVFCLKKKKNTEKI